MPPIQMYVQPIQMHVQDFCASLCPVSLARLKPGILRRNGRVRAYYGSTLYKYINYSFPSSRRITTVGASLTTRRRGVCSPSEWWWLSSTSLNTYHLHTHARAIELQTGSGCARTGCPATSSPEKANEKLEAVIRQAAIVANFGDVRYHSACPSLLDGSMPTEKPAFRSPDFPHGWHGTRTPDLATLVAHQRPQVHSSSLLL
eukprot:COSAG02_NODE_48_length_45421_cov_103.222100_27_plen_202_part_00